MTVMPWPAGFEEALRPYLPLLAAGEPLDPDLSLAEAGVDSLTSVRLLVELEQRFAVTIPDEQLTAATFASPASLWAVLSALIAEESP